MPMLVVEVGRVRVRVTLRLVSVRVAVWPDRRGGVKMVVVPIVVRVGVLMP